jgi:hypothetical protein
MPVRTTPSDQLRVRASRVIRSSATRVSAVAFVLAPLAFAAAPAHAASDPAVVQPIYSSVKDAPQNDLALRRFTTAAQRFGLGPVEVVYVEGDPAPKTAEKLRAAIVLVRKLELDAGRAALDDAAAEAAATGGGGLDAAALSDLYLYRAWAISRTDFNTEHVSTPTARAQAYPDLVRAATLVPGRQLNLQQFPPLLLDDWARAVADAGARPQTTLVVRAAPEALVSCDGGPPVPGPATFVGLAQGEHLIHVDDPGWADWGGAITAEGPTIELAIPARRALTLDDAVAAAHARRMGTKFALVAEPRPGRDGGLSLELHLVDIAGTRRDSSIEPLAGDAGALDAAVMRLDEQARRLDRNNTTAAVAVAATDPAAQALPPPVLVAPLAQRARFNDDPGAWARDHWPLLTAAGIMLGAALVLSIGVATDGPSR